MRALTHRITFVCLGLSCSVAIWWSNAQAPAAAQKADRAAASSDIEGTKKLWGALVYAAKDAASKREGFEDADAEMTQALQKVFKDYKHFQEASMMLLNHLVWVIGSFISLLFFLRH